MNKEKCITAIYSVCCIGAGYVGGPTMVVMASKWPEIRFIVVDVNERQIEAWNSDRLPIYEPGLEKLILECRDKNLFFSTDIKSAIEESQIIFVAVNTPTKIHGVGAGKATNLAYWESAARTISEYSKSSKIVVEKSTVPVRTAQTLLDILNATKTEDISFSVLSNPEFLSEGRAIHDLLSPDRVLIGEFVLQADDSASAFLRNLYARWIPEEKIVTCNVWSTELAKLVANGMLAQRISSINSIAMICEKTEADIKEVSFAVGKDSRIGPGFLEASLGFGGSCFTKDVLSLSYIAESLGLDEVAEYWEKIVEMNNLQKTKFAENIVEKMFHNLIEKRVTLLGFAYKKNTGDVRETPAVLVCKKLLDEGALISVYDPKVLADDAIREMKSKMLDTSNISFNNSAEEAATNSHCLIIVTEWEEFLTLDYQVIYDLMRRPSFLFDGRNLLYGMKEKLTKIGFRLYGVGIGG